MQLPDLALAERDAKMLEAYKSGFNYREIGRQFNVATSTAHSGVQRALKKEATRYSQDAQNIGWLMYERYETLIKHLIPFTKSQVIQDPTTGENTRVPPSYDAVDRLLKVLQAEGRMFGLDKDTIAFEVQPSGSPDVSDGAANAELTPEDFAKQIVTELIKTGAASGEGAELLEQLLGGDIIDVEVIEEDDEEETLALESGPGVPSLLDREVEEAPEWLDEDEEDYAPGSWIPENMDDATDYRGK